MRIIYDEKQRRAVLLHGTRAVGYEFCPLTEGAVHITAQKAAEWFNFGMQTKHVGPECFENNEVFLNARRSFYALMSHGARMATALNHEAPEKARFFIEAAFRGHLSAYAAAIVEISKVQGTSLEVASDRLNPRLAGWSWIVEAAKADVLHGVPMEQVIDDHTESEAGPKQSI